MLAHYWKAEKFTASQEEGNVPLGAGTADPRITEPERVTSAKKKRAEGTRGSKRERGEKVPKNTKVLESEEEQRKENVSTTSELKISPGRPRGRPRRHQQRGT